jgi:hypothetical protein
VKGRQRGRAAFCTGVIEEGLVAFPRHSNREIRVKPFCPGCGRVFTRGLARVCGHCRNRALKGLDPSPLRTSSPHIELDPISASEILTLIGEPNS